MPQISNRASLFTDSVIRRMTRISDACPGSINLSQGFPDFDPPKQLLDALAKVAYNGPHQYSVTFGAENFREALAVKAGKTLKRKINEAWLTVRLETHYTKEDILEGYLNTINYGGVFGVENASKYYFGKSSKDLTLAEASLLAGIPNYPSKYSPFVDLEASKKRQLVVLKSMQRDGYISENELNKAYNEEIIFKNDEENNELNSIMYYQDEVIKELNSINSIPTSLQSSAIFINFSSLMLNSDPSQELNKIGLSFRYLGLMM